MEGTLAHLNIRSRMFEERWSEEPSSDRDLNRLFLSELLQPTDHFKADRLPEFVPDTSALNYLQFSDKKGNVSLILNKSTMQR